MSQAAVLSTDQWMLRAKGGQEYGPVSFDVLRAWAAQNRFTAGYEISNNQRDWQSVEKVPELGMDWFVEPGDGSRYGPFHPLALLDYIREGAVPPETRVIHKANGGEAKAYQVLLEAFVDAIDQTAEAQGELIRQVQVLQERLEERDRWFSEENRQIQEEREKRQEAERECRRLEKQGTLTAELQARLAQAESDLGPARKDAESERRIRLETVSRLEAELCAVRAAGDQRLRDAEERLQALRASAEAAQQSYDRRQAEFDALKAEDAARQQELAQARESGSRQRQDVEERLKKAESQASEAAAAASRAEAELAVIRGRQERERQAHESEKDELVDRAVSKVRQEAEELSASLAQQREAAEALSREVAVQRSENVILRDRLESVKADVEEAARTDRELVQLRQAAAALTRRAAELEGERERARAEQAAAHRELEFERGRVRLLEVRVAERADWRPLREDREEPRRRAGVENGTRPAWASGPVVEVPASGPAGEARAPADGIRMPPPRKPGSLAGLEAQAQAELKAWQEKKQAPPKADPAPKNKSWIPWK